MKSHILRAACVAAAALLVPHSASATAIAVDVDPITPGIQAATTVPLGAMVTADIYIISDGVTPIDAYGVSVEFNDTAGILALAAPPPSTLFDLSGVGLAALSPGSSDLALGVPPVPIGPGVPLTPLAIAPFGVGPGGPFTANDGAAGAFEALPAPGGFFGAPGIPPIGAAILAETIMFTATGVGMSDIAPLGIMAPAAPPGTPAPLAIFGPGGVEFYETLTGLGVAAAPVPGFTPAGVNPATVTVIVPEPSTLALLGLGLLAAVRRRRCHS